MADTKGQSKIYPQFVAASLANLATFSAGIAYRWSSPVALKLASNNTNETPLGTTIGTSSDEYAWISSLLIIGTIVGPLSAAYLCEKLGRKWTLIVGGFFFIVSSILFIFGYYISIWYTSRILQGCGAGIILTTQPIYIGEIASDNVRGALGTLLHIFIIGGAVYSQAFGTYTSYYVMQYACLAIPVIFIATFFFMPESPFYLVSKGRTDEAIESLHFLRCESSETLYYELSIIQDLVAVKVRSKWSIMSILKLRGNLKAFLICLGLTILQQCSGFDAVLLNLQIILQEAYPDMNIGLVLIFVGLSQLVVSVCSPLVVSYFQRKTILLVSLIFLCASQICLGSFFYMVEIQVNTSSFSWLPLVSIIVYLTSISLGFSPVIYAITAEIFSSEIKASASGILMLIGNILSFLTARWYPTMRAFGEYFPFWLFAALCAVGTNFVWLVVIETKGLSLQEIQDKLNTRTIKS